MSLCSYFLLSDINKHVKIKINSLKGYQFPDELDIKSSSHYSPITTSRAAELYVTCEIWSRGTPLGLPSSTTYKCFSPSPSPSELTTPLTSTMTIGGAPAIRWGEWLTFPVKYRDLGPTSRLVLTVWSITPPKTPPPSSSDHIPTTTIPTSALVAALPSHSPPIQPPLETCDAVPLGGTCLPMFNKKGVLKLGRRKLFLHNGRAGDGDLQTTPYKVGTMAGMDRLEKMIRKYDQRELPCVKWLDKLALRKIEMMQTKENTLYPSEQGKMYLTVEFPAFKHPVVFHQKLCNVSPPTILPHDDRDRIVVLYDPASTSENPIENKYHKLARSSKGIADRDLKPQITERKAIQAILSSPNKRLTVGEKELLWKFRFSLTEDKRALTKFLRCVNWFDANETKQALDLLQEWAAIDIADALELLSGYFTNEGVRTYAVKQLQRADNEELGGYLLQLVQALRYETNYPSVLSEFLITRASQNFQLTNFLYWFLNTEVHDPRKSSMYARVVTDFMDVLKKRGGEPATWEKQLVAAGELVKNLIALGNESKVKATKIDKRIDRMRYLVTEGEYKSLRRFPAPIRMPVRPEIEVTGLVGEDSTMFRSALAPLLAAFTTPNGPHYKVIFKSGDDLRQDQLIIQMINLMDALLKKVKLDLQLTPYRVLATSPEDGFVEFVPHSHTLTSVLDKYDKDIRKFIRVHNSTDIAFNKALDVFVKSCAGYCVITYILGIGDRHFDNVLLTTSGHIFHIDFGFIFGKDPKPFPPPMKFSKEMVEAMGGSSSAHYHDFRRYCVSAFNILRQHASLIINLLSLMGDANIPDLAIDVERNLLKVQEKFRLDLADEEAGHFLLGLLDQSVSALFPVMMEKIHKWALYWK